jgi:RND family efflux transporter MFP subunit
MHTNDHLTALMVILSVMASEMSCTRNRTAETGLPQMDAVSGMLILTPAQIENAGIETGKVEYTVMESVIECTGIVETPPQNYADVTVAIGGLVKSCSCHPGDYVKAGQSLAVLEHPDYIRLQQEFLETKSQWEFYKEDFKRQGELTIENAASVKTMQQAQSSFRSTEVKLFALKSQLVMLGINADSLSVENMSPCVNLTAPISGYLTDCSLHIGSYVGPGFVTCRIVNNSELYLVLQADEKSLHRIKTGQPVEFSLVSDPSVSYNARVTGVSPVVSNTENTYGIRAVITGRYSGLFSGMHVKAIIHAGEQSCPTLPLSAIAPADSGTVVFIQTRGGFLPVPVKTKEYAGDRVALTEWPAGLADSTLVIKGADYLKDAGQEGK